jgi:hypothetical protein
MRESLFGYGMTWMPGHALPEQRLGFIKEILPEQGISLLDDRRQTVLQYHMVIGLAPTRVLLNPVDWKECTSAGT